MWPIFRLKAENGATLTGLGSHNAGLAKDAQPWSRRSQPAAILFPAWRRMAPAPTRLVRSGVASSSAIAWGWLKPCENQWLTYPPDAARAFDPELAALVTSSTAQFRQWRMASVRPSCFGANPPTSGCHRCPAIRSGRCAG
jgi:hypothetical protein